MNQADKSTPQALVAIVMGSKSDAGVMIFCKQTLEILEISYEARVLSAHRTPDEMLMGKKCKVSWYRSCNCGCRRIGCLTWRPCCTYIDTGDRRSFKRRLPYKVWMPYWPLPKMPFGMPVATMAIGEAAPRMRR